MVKFELLSDNLVTIMTQLTTNQTLCKYLTVYQGNPLSQPDLTNPISLIRNNIFPYPFLIPAETTEVAQIHVYYPRAKIDKRVIQNNRVTFDIVCHKNLWLTNDGASSVRPYKIATEIMRIFDETSIGKVGRLNFTGFDHLMFNDNFQAFSLFAEMMEIGSSQPTW